jgi:hypothetical protein
VREPADGPGGAGQERRDGEYEEEEPPRLLLLLEDLEALGEDGARVRRLAERAAQVLDGVQAFLRDAQFDEAEAHFLPELRGS